MNFILALQYYINFDNFGEILIIDGNTSMCRREVWNRSQVCIEDISLVQMDWWATAEWCSRHRDCCSRLSAVVLLKCYVLDFGYGQNLVFNSNLGSKLNLGFMSNLDLVIGYLFVMCDLSFSCLTSNYHEFLLPNFVFSNLWLSSLIWWRNNL